MSKLSASVVLWLAGGIIGAALSPRHRVAGGMLGAILVGAFGDVALDRIDNRRNAITN